MKSFQTFRGNSGNVSRDRSLGDHNNYMQGASNQDNSNNHSVITANEGNNPYSKYMSPTIRGYPASGAHGTQTPEKTIYANEFYSKCSNEKQQPQTVDQSLICQTCELPFNEGIRCPRLMPQCGHSFCNQCLKSAFERVQQMKSQGNMNVSSMMDSVSYFISEKCTLQCPEDEIELDKSITSVEGLRKNFALIQRIMGQRQQSQQKQNNMAVADSYGLSQSQYEPESKSFFDNSQVQEKKKFRPSHLNQNQAVISSQQLFDKLLVEQQKQDVVGVGTRHSQILPLDFNKLGNSMHEQNNNSTFDDNRIFENSMVDNNPKSTYQQYQAAAGPKAAYGRLNSGRGSAVNVQVLSGSNSHASNTAAGSFTERLNLPRQTVAGGKGSNVFRSNSRGNGSTQMQPAPATARLAEAGGFGFNIKLQQMGQMDLDGADSQIENKRNTVKIRSPDQSRNQNMNKFNNTMVNAKKDKLRIDAGYEGNMSDRPQIVTPDNAPVIKFNLNLNDEMPDDHAGGIGHGPMHGSIINHLRDSPLKKTIQQRIVMNNQAFGNEYQDMIMEEDDESDQQSIKLRRQSMKSQGLNNTARSNLRLTNKSTQQNRVEHMKQHNWHEKFKAYKSNNGKMMDMKEALNQQLMGLKQTFMQQDNSDDEGIPLGRNVGKGIKCLEGPHTQMVSPNFDGPKKESILICQAHEKPRELICITCRTMICHTCALFGDHKGHDVRERVDTMREIEVRTEVLMEMFEQMDQEVEKLVQDTNWQRLKNVMTDRQNYLKTMVSSKFNEWHELLNKMEIEAHKVVDERFTKYETIFTEEAEELAKVADENRLLMLKMGDILNNYMTEIEADTNYISFDILDSNLSNENSVESMYQQIEKNLEHNSKIVQFAKLEPLEQEYDKIYVWFDKNFEQRIQNVTQVVDKEHPLIAILDQDKPLDTSKNSNTSINNKQLNLKNKFMSYKNSFQKGTSMNNKDDDIPLFKDSSNEQQNNSSNHISSASFEDALASQQQQQIDSSAKPITVVPKGIIVMDKAASGGMSSEGQSTMPSNTLELPFESVNQSIKIEEIDFSKLSMIAGGGNEMIGKPEGLSQDAIKEIVQQQVQAALQQQQNASNQAQSEILKNLQMLMQSSAQQPQQPPAKQEEKPQKETKVAQIVDSPETIGDDDNDSDTGIERMTPDKSPFKEDRDANSGQKSQGSGLKPPMMSKKKTMGLSQNRLSLVPAGTGKKQSHSRENSANRVRTLNKSKNESQGVKNKADDQTLTQRLDQIKQDGRKEAKGLSQTTVPKSQKSSFNLAESFKIQAEIGDIDLSGKGLTDNHSMQLCQLLKQYAREDVENLDLGSNKFTDNGILNICKALSETQITRLVISNNKLTEKCCEPVTGVLMRNKHLNILNMQDNQIQSRVAKNKLINALPKIDVVI